MTFFLKISFFKVTTFLFSIQNAFNLHVVEFDKRYLTYPTPTYLSDSVAISLKLQNTLKQTHFEKIASSEL